MRDTETKSSTDSGGKAVMSWVGANHHTYLAFSVRPYSLESIFMINRLSGDRYFSESQKSRSRERDGYKSTAKAKEADISLMKEGMSRKILLYCMKTKIKANRRDDSMFADQTRRTFDSRQ